VENELFKISVPPHWKIHTKFQQPVSMSSTNINNSPENNFLLTVIRYDPFYLKKNHLVKYVRFQSGYYKDYEAVILVRNDLLPDKEQQTVEWRIELRVLNKMKGELYLLILSKRASHSQEPDWCQFKEIFDSFKIKE
jgi:hypothetical protein